MMWIIAAIVFSVALAAWMVWRTMPDNSIVKEKIRRETEFVPLSHLAYARRLAWNLYQFSRRKYRMKPGDRRRAKAMRKKLDDLVPWADSKRQLRSECKTIRKKRDTAAFADGMMKLLLKTSRKQEGVV